MKTEKNSIIRALRGLSVSESDRTVVREAIALIRSLSQENKELMGVLASTVAAWESDRAELHQRRLRFIEPASDALRCCYTCAHFDARAGDDPCRLCDNNSKWEPK